MTEQHVACLARLRWSFIRFARKLDIVFHGLTLWAFGDWVMCGTCVGDDVKPKVRNETNGQLPSTWDSPLDVNLHHVIIRAVSKPSQ